MKTYSGSCHCGKVKFEVDIENLNEVMSCNCSICAKRGWLLAFVPDSAFRLLAGEEDLTTYHFNKKAIDHLFCKHCGVASFSRSSMGNAINVCCLDNVDMSTLSVKEYNGKDL